MTDTLTINSLLSLHRALQHLSDEWEAHKFIRVAIKTGQDRSLSQNAISHVWYGQVSRELREQTAEDVRCECKLRFGVPILRAEDADFRELYDTAIRRNLSYEQKLMAMRYLPVSSLMTKQQLSRYLEAMQVEYAPRGVVLEFPSEREVA